MLMTVKRTVSLFLSSLILLLGSAFPQYTDQVETLKTITKVNDMLYFMDYKFDYDSEEMVERGQFCTVDLILHNLIKLSGADNAGFACTTFQAVDEDGDCLFGRNFDYESGTAMVVWTHPKDGYASLGLMDLALLGCTGEDLPENIVDNALVMLAPHACVDGINEKGLAIGVLEIEKEPTFQMTSKKDITTTGMIRLCLDHAATVDEAIEIFESYDMRDFLFGECTYHYQITDACGNSAIVEYVDGKMVILRPSVREDGQIAYQAATNFILSYQNGVWDREKDPDGMGEDRYQTVMNKLAETGGILSESEAMNLLKSCSMDQEDLNGYICDTLWRGVYNNSKKTLQLVTGLDYDHVMTLSVEEPCVLR